MLIGDGQQEPRLRFFHFNKAQQRVRDGKHIRAFGSVTFIGRHLAMAHPNTESLMRPRTTQTRADTGLSNNAGPSQARLRTLTKAPQQLDWPKASGTPFEKPVPAQAG